MKLKNFLIVVKDIEKSRKYYHDLFGLEMVVDNGGNMILTDGLVLQAETYWKEFIQSEVVGCNNSSELYFEESDIEGFLKKLETLYPDTLYVNKLMTHSWGQRVVRFYDPDGNLIEVGTPVYLLETNRLKIYPASREQMEVFIAAQQIDELKAAYSEMLNGAMTHPEQWEWHAIWMIELKDSTHVGELCFKGVDEFGSTEIGYGIADSFQNQGYATEAVAAVATWALNQDTIKSVTAEVENDNIMSIRVLEKSGFELSDKLGEEGLIYCKVKELLDK